MSEIFTKYGSQGFIQNFELGGKGGGGGGGWGCGLVGTWWQQDDSSVCKRACLFGGLGACFPRKILNLDPLRLLLTQSGTRLLYL